MAGENTEINQAIAISRYNPISQKKVWKVAHFLTKMSCDVALAQLKNMPNMAARYLYKTLLSARDNLLYKNIDSKRKLEDKDIIIKKVDVSEGPVLKRIQPISRGRAARIKKRRCHIRFVIEYVGKGE